MPAKVKSAAVLAKEAAKAAAAGTLSDSFEDAEDVVDTGISKDLFWGSYLTAAWCMNSWKKFGCTALLRK